jgi:hypothetical protein
MAIEDIKWISDSLTVIREILKTKKGKLGTGIFVIVVGIGIWKILCPPTTKQLSFEVLDETNNNPLHPATVILHKAGGEPASAPTNRQGIVSFSIKENDACSEAKASAPKYESNEASSSELISNCFKIKDTIKIKLKPETKVSFKIMTEGNGRAIIGASVTLDLENKKENKATVDGGMVSFTVHSLDKCINLTVENEGYETKKITSPTLIPSCHTMRATTDVKLKKDVPDSQPVTGTDLNGKRADFIFSSLTDKYAWEYGSSKNLVLRSSQNNEQKPIDAKQEIKKYLSNPAILADIKDSEMLIAIGSSSCEGYQTTEEDRAKERGSVIKEALKEFPDKPRGKEIPAFTLGQYVNSVCNSNRVSTDIQRRLLIVRVVKDNGADIPSALNDAANQDVVKKWLSDYLIRGDKGNGIRPYGDLDIKKYSGYNRFNPY